MKTDLNTTEFLNGNIGIKISSNEQSQFLINLSQKNGFDVGSYEEFKTDTYKEYPYYFIEDNWQLQACDSLENLLYSCEESANFEDWFELKEEIKND